MLAKTFRAAKEDTSSYVAKERRDGRFFLSFLTIAIFHTSWQSNVPPSIQLALSREKEIFTPPPHAQSPSDEKN